MRFLQEWKSFVSREQLHNPDVLNPLPAVCNSQKKRRPRPLRTFAEFLPPGLL